ncbi:hypothetical protein Baya_12977 [Bagarius yarrelli]|uniref:Uncharacterized protein n=1 Tax=Bagarius yarrelli TaxID=175774 RepID=A0A556V4X0_BAGYA|nr:hypothetical protein Baya_12977 [Bagarius yarrelli]
MDRKISIRRATSAGYRLPERPSVALTSQSSVSVRKPPQSAQRNTSEPLPVRDPDTHDPVKQDRVWKELVRAERDRLKEWEKNWSFLKDFDQLGHPRTEVPLPSYVSLYSNTVPNTSNQMFGNRVCTELGKELMRMDRMEKRLKKLEAMIRDPRSAINLESLLVRARALDSCHFEQTVLVFIFFSSRTKYSHIISQTFSVWLLLPAGCNSVHDDDEGVDALLDFRIVFT